MKTLPTNERKTIKDAVFFCTTPYQIMTASHIATAKEYEADIYLIDQMGKVNEIADRLRCIKIFQNVGVIHEKDLLGNNANKTLTYLKLSKIYFFINNSVESIINTQIEYREIFVSSKAFIGRIVSMYYIKNGYNTKVVYYDDGLGSYYDKNILRPRAYDKILRYLTLGTKARKMDANKLLLYEPDLFKKNNANYQKNIELQALRKWNDNVGFIEKMNSVFAYSEKDRIIAPIIIFDGIFNQNERLKVNAFYRKLIDIFGAEDIIIKTHPRDQSERIKGVNYYSRSELPFEIICANSEMDNKLLITVLSTAVITPVMLLGIEPYVLTLNEIKDFLEAPFSMNYQDFKDIYKDKTRFCIADTLDNAILYIKKVINNGGYDNV